jgi:hypothetical protein
VFVEREVRGCACGWAWMEESMMILDFFGLF